MIDIVTNVAGGQLPGWLMPVTRWAWPVLLALALVATALDRAARSAAEKQANELSAVLHDRALLLNRWEQYWKPTLDRIQGYLSKQQLQALGDTPPIPLHLQRIDGDGSDPGDIVAAYYEYSSLLLIGGSGAGKSALLLRLAEVLLERSRAEEVYPLPILLSLADWGRRRRHWRRRPDDEVTPDLGGWLIDQMYRQYGIKPVVARSWLAQHRLVLILDGLDELPRRTRMRHARLLADFLADRSCPPVVVSSRLGEYFEASIKLPARTIVAVQAISRDQLTNYLNSGHPRLEGLRNAIDADPMLWELIDSPLWLHIAQRVYEFGPAPIEVSSGSLSRRRRRLLDQYIAVIVGRRRTASRFAEDRTMRWLVQAAQLVHADDYPTIVDLRHVTDRAVLPPGAALGFYAWVVAPAAAMAPFIGLVVPMTWRFGVLAGALGAVVGGIIVGQTVGRLPTHFGTDPTTGRWLRRLAGWLAGSAAGAAGGWLAYRAGSLMTSALVHLPEVWSRVFAFAAVCMAGAVFVAAASARRVLRWIVAVAVVLVGVAVAVVPLGQSGILPGIGYASACTLMVLSILFVIGYGRKDRSRGQQATRFAVLPFYLVSLGGLAHAWVRGIRWGAWVWPTCGMLLGALIAFLLALIVNAVAGSSAKRAAAPTVVRWALAWGGLQPWQALPFLRHLANLGLVTRVDASWRLRHALFVDHLANDDPLDAATASFRNGIDGDEAERARLIEALRPASTGFALCYRPESYLIHRPGVLLDPAAEPGGALQGANDLADLYDRAQRSLLLFGEPGEYRHWLIERLAETLWQRAASSYDQPVPVVIDLPKWARGRPDGRSRQAVGWVCRYLLDSYRIDPGTTLRWLAARDLVLIIDGLDQPVLKRPVIGALNELLSGDHPVPMVVSAQIEPYKKASACLMLAVAVEVADIAPLLPAGTRRYPLLAVGNSLCEEPTKVRRLFYHGRSLSRMREYGVPPLVVEQAVRDGVPTRGSGNLLVLHDVANGVLVLVEDRRRRSVCTVALQLTETDEPNVHPAEVIDILNAYKTGALTIGLMVDQLEYAVRRLSPVSLRDVLYTHWWAIEQNYAMSLIQPNSAEPEIQATVLETLATLGDMLSEVQLM